MKKCALYGCRHLKDFVLPTTMCRECLISTVATLFIATDNYIDKQVIADTINNTYKSTDKERKIWAAVDWIIKYEDIMIRIDTINMINLYGEINDGTGEDNQDLFVD